MDRRILIACLVISACLTLHVEAAAQEPEAITSRVETTKTGDLILVEEVLVKAPVARVWEAYTTSQGWEAWAATVAKVDFQVGGEIRTTYTPGSSVDGEDAIVQHVLNFVPEKLITLQAEVSDQWPDVLKEREKQMYNVILFQRLDGESTKITSYGMGYKDTPELRAMLDFFKQANAELYRKLITYLESNDN